MTETQATQLIEATERVEVLLDVVAYFIQVTAYCSGAAAGLLLTIVFTRALLVKRIIT